MKAKVGNGVVSIVDCDLMDEIGSNDLGNRLPQSGWMLLMTLKNSWQQWMVCSSTTEILYKIPTNHTSCELLRFFFLYVDYILIRLKLGWISASTLASNNTITFLHFPFLRGQLSLFVQLQVESGFSFLVSLILLQQFSMILDIFGIRL